MTLPSLQTHTGKDKKSEINNSEAKVAEEAEVTAMKRGKSTASGDTEDRRLSTTRSERSTANCQHDFGSHDRSARRNTKKETVNPAEEAEVAIIAAIEHNEAAARESLNPVTEAEVANTGTFEVAMGEPLNSAAEAEVANTGTFEVAMSEPLNSAAEAEVANTGTLEHNNDVLRNAVNSAANAEAAETDADLDDDVASAMEFQPPHRDVESDIEALNEYEGHLDPDLNLLEAMDISSVLGKPDDFPNMSDIEEAELQLLDDSYLEELSLEADLDERETGADEPEGTDDRVRPDGHISNHTDDDAVTQPLDLGGQSLEASLDEYETGADEPEGANDRVRPNERSNNLTNNDAGTQPRNCDLGVGRQAVQTPGGSRLRTVTEPDRVRGQEEPNVTTPPTVHTRAAAGVNARRAGNRQDNVRSTVSKSSPAREPEVGAKCALCSSVTSKAELGAHVADRHSHYFRGPDLSLKQRHWPSSNLRCGVCGKVLGNAPIYLRHMIEKHTVENTLPDGTVAANKPVKLTASVAALRHGPSPSSSTDNASSSVSSDSGTASQTQGAHGATNPMFPSDMSSSTDTPMDISSDESGTTDNRTTRFNTSASATAGPIAPRRSTDSASTMRGDATTQTEATAGAAPRFDAALPRVRSVELIFFRQGDDIAKVTEHIGELLAVAKRNRVILLQGFTMIVGGAGPGGFSVYTGLNTARDVFSSIAGWCMIHGIPRRFFTSFPLRIRRQAHSAFREGLGVHLGDHGLRVFPHAEEGGHERREWVDAYVNILYMAGQWQLEKHMSRTDASRLPQLAAMAANGHYRHFAEEAPYVQTRLRWTPEQAKNFVTFAVAAGSPALREGGASAVIRSKAPKQQLCDSEFQSLINKHRRSRLIRKQTAYPEFICGLCYSPNHEAVTCLTDREELNLPAPYFGVDSSTMLRNRLEPPSGTAAPSTHAVATAAPAAVKSNIHKRLGEGGARKSAPRRPSRSESRTAPQPYSHRSPHSSGKHRGRKGSKATADDGGKDPFVPQWVGGVRRNASSPSLPNSLSLFGGAPVAGEPCNFVLYGSNSKRKHRQLVIRHDTGAVESVVPRSLLPEIREAAGKYCREYRDGEDDMVEFALKLQGLVKFVARVDDNVHESRLGRREQVLMGQNDIMRNSAELSPGAEMITFGKNVGTARILSL